MDIVTHFALGACIAEFARKKNENKKILFLGGFVQCLPDIDTIEGLFLPADRSLMIHRGITHSFFFAVVAGVILSLFAYRIFKAAGRPFLSISLFVVFQLILHDLLDVCNAYGTALLEPFNHRRFSLNLLFVADPLFSLGLIIAAMVLLFSNGNYNRRLKWVRAALLFSYCYLAYAGINKTIIDSRISTALHNRKIGFKDYFATPAPFNSVLWYIIVDTDSCYYTAYSSVYDSKSRNIEFETHPKNYGLLNLTRGRHSVQNFREFAAGYYTISGSANKPYINILRFGQIQGWRIRNAPFVLSCPLISNGPHIVPLQQARLTGWDMNSITVYFRRITGN